MSKTIDERVVEMRFDNRNFESNVNTTLSTLDKLKAKLNLSGASKSLANLGSAAKKVDMTGIGNAVETVTSKFSALEVMGVTALANITNAAVNAGKRIAYALTLEPVKTGFDEYETKINAIQTILSNTSSKGEDIQSVTRVIDDLNTYADKTIYNFAQMTKNIGTFTAAGVGLQDSADAIKGIANLAAMSGSNSQQASTAMYQLSQALAAGTVKLMDWNSVVNAGMGGEKFQEALKSTAREMGIGVDAMIEKNGSFRESLQEGWITADVLNTTLKKFTVEGAAEYAESMVQAGKYTQEQADALMKEAEMAEEAATRVKTLSQLWSTLKETAQSGWGKTWELIFGNYEEAKIFFTDLNNLFGPIIDGLSDARNNLIQEAMSSKWSEFTTRLDDMGISVDTFTEKLKEVAKENNFDINGLIKEFGTLEAVIAKGKVPADLLISAFKRLTGTSKEAESATSNLSDKLEHYQKLVDDIWRGDYGNGVDRINALTEAGYEYQKVQDLVNKSVDGYRLTLDDVTDLQLKAIGYTDEEVEQLRELGEQAENTGVPIEELLKSLEKPSGRELLLDSLMNALKGVIKVCSTLKEAWRDIFPPISADGLYSAIEALNRFSQKLIMSDETAEQLKRTFKGLFAAFDIVAMITNGGLRIALKALNTVLGMFDLNILGATANLGDMIVAFRDWLDSVFDVSGAIEYLTPYIKGMVNGIVEWVNALRKSEDPVGFVISSFKEGFSSLLEWIKRVATEGVKLLSEKLGKFKLNGSFFDQLKEYGKQLLGNMSEGFQNGAKALFESIKTTFNTIVEYIKGIDLGTVFAGFLMGGMLYTINHFIEAFGGIGKLAEGLGKAVSNLGDLFKAYAFEAKARGILKLAIAVGILAASIYVLAKLDSEELKRSLISLTVIVGLLIILSYTTSKLGSAVDSIGKTGGILMLAGAMLVIAIAIRSLSSIDSEGIKNSIHGIIVALSAMLILIGMSKLLAKDAISLKVVGPMLLKMAAAIGLMVYVVKMASSLDKGQVTRGAKVIAMIELLFIAAIAVSKIAGEHSSSAGSMLLKMTIAMALMIGVVKLAASLSVGEVRKGIKVLAQIELLFLAAMAVSKLAGQYGSKAGSMFLGMAVSFLVIGYAIKNISGIAQSDIDSAIKTFSKISILFGAMMILSRWAGQNAAKAGIFLVTLSVSLLILTGAITLLSGLNADKVQSATDAISQVMAMMSILLIATGKSGKAAGSLTSMAISISILCGALIALSFVDRDKLINAMAAVSVVILFMKSLKDVKLSTAIGTVITLGLFILALSLILKNMDSIDGENALQNAKGIGAMLVGLAIIMKAIGDFDIMDYGIVWRLLIVLGGLVAVVELLSLILWQLDSMDVNTNMNNIYALCMLLGTMSIVMAVLSNFSTGLTWKDFGTISLSMTTLAGVMAILGLVLAMMSALNVSNAITNATALSILIGALCVVMVPLGFIGRMGPQILWGALAMTALSGVMAILGLVLAMMSSMNVQNGITNAAALSILLGAIAIALIPMGLIGVMGPSILWGALGMAALSGVLAILGLVLAEMSALNVQNGIENAKALSILIGALALASVPIGLMGLLGPSILLGAVGVLALSGVLAILGLVLAEMSALNVQNGIENAKALSILILALSVAMVPLGLIGLLGPAALIGCAALALIGAVLLGAIAAFNEWIAPGLPEAATNLSNFMTNLQPFVEGAKNIDESAVQGCKNIANMITALSGAAITDGIMSFFSGGGSWTDGIGDTLKTFADAMVVFSNTLTAGNFSPEAVNAAANAGMMIAKLEDALPRSGGSISESINSLIGEKDISGFSEDLAAFGKAMAAFSDNVKDVKPEAVEAAANAGTMLAEMADTIPNSGGKLAEFLGDNTMDVFGEQLVAFGEYMSEFSKKVSGENAIDTDAVTAASEAGKALAEMANEIPNEGGWLAKIVGDNQIDAFGEKLPLFGEALAGFAQEVDGINPDAVTAAAQAGKSLAEMAATIPNEGGWIAKIVGENSLDTFAENIQKLGEGMKSFSDEVTGIDADSVSNAPTIMTALKDAIDKLPSKDAMKGKLGEKDIQNLSTAIQSIATLSECSDKISKLDTSKLPGAIEDIKKLISTMKGMKSSDFSGVSAFTTALFKLATTSIDKFASTFSNGSGKISNSVNTMLGSVANKAKGQTQKFADVGKEIIVRLSTGMSKSYKRIGSTLSDAISNAVASIRSKYQSFYSAGSYLMDGLSAGIRASAYKAANAAANAMITAVNAAKKAAGIQSPSKVFYGIGEFTVAGFVNALTDLNGKVYDSGYGMADSARKGFSNAITKINDSFNGLVPEGPTIRPVLDLSSVESGANSINSMFGMSPSVRLLSDIRGIDSMINSRQNGNGTAEVISAIDKLRKEIGNVGGTTNYINGITYDDGSNVSDAISTLVRAARIERRK